MIKNLMKCVGCLIALVMLTGCSSNRSLVLLSTEYDSKLTKKTKVIVKEEVAEYKQKEREYKQGDIPRIYITTANFANKLNSVNNIALDKKVTVSSCEMDDLREAYLVDGNKATRWASGYSEDENFVIDLGKTASFGYITMNFESAYGKEYTISVSDDKSNWKQIIDEKNGSAGDKEYIFQEVSARYIKWQGIKRGTKYGYSICEFGVYKDKESANNPLVADKTDYPYLNLFTDKYQPISITIVDGKGGKFKSITDNKSTIRIRGNSTALTNKKSYNFKLSKKEDVLGLGAGKKWCLLANNFDKTLLRNKIAYDFADSLGLPIKLNSTYTEVYIDDIYGGTYLLSEPVSDGKNRVDIDTKKNEFIFERCVFVDYYAEAMIESPIYKLNFELKEPDSKVVTKEQKNELINFLGRTEAAIKSGRQSVIKKSIDVNSFAAMYVFEELFKNADYTFDSNYFYIKDGKIYAGPIWDMDISMGNVSSVYEFDPYYIYNNKVVGGKKYGNGSGESTEGVWALKNWYEELMKYDFFKKLVSDKLKQVEKSYDLLYTEGGTIDILVKQYGTSFEKNYMDTYWDLTKSYSKYEREKPEDTYSANVKFLKDWLKKRKQWIYSNIK